MDPEDIFLIVVRLMSWLYCDDIVIVGVGSQGGSTVYYVDQVTRQM